MCFSIRQIDPHRPKPGLARRRIRLFSHAQIVQKKDPDTFDPRRILPLTARFVISLMRSKRRGKKKQDRFGKAPFAPLVYPGRESIKAAPPCPRSRPITEFSTRGTLPPLPRLPLACWHRSHKRSRPSPMRRDHAHRRPARYAA